MYDCVRYLDMYVLDEQSFLYFKHIDVNAD